MRKKGELEREVCRNLCVYYKPGKNEDLSCLGYRVVEALVTRRRELVLTQIVGRATAEERMIAEVMCKRCPFYPEDCDYVIKEGDASPCGGFLALSGLLLKRMITVDEIGDALDRAD